jgi:hypothetical protein
MRLLVALLLVAAVLHTQLAEGCYCHHEARHEAAHAGSPHGDLPDAERGGHPTPTPSPCNGCAHCEQGDPVGLRVEAPLDVNPADQVIAWGAPAAEVLSAALRPAARLVTTPPDCGRSLLACGTLLRI